MLHCPVSNLFPLQSFFDEKMQLLLVKLIMSFLEGWWSPILLSYRIFCNGVDLKTFIHV